MKGLPQHCTRFACGGRLSPVLPSPPSAPDLLGQQLLQERGRRRPRLPPLLLRVRLLRVGPPRLRVGPLRLVLPADPPAAPPPLAPAAPALAPPAAAAALCKEAVSPTRHATAAAAAAAPRPRLPLLLGIAAMGWRAWPGPVLSSLGAGRGCCCHCWRCWRCSVRHTIGELRCRGTLQPRSLLGACLAAIAAALLQPPLRPLLLLRRRRRPFRCAAGALAPVLCLLRLLGAMLVRNGLAVGPAAVSLEGLLGLRGIAGLQEGFIAKAGRAAAAPVPPTTPCGTHNAVA